MYLAEPIRQGSGEGFGGGGEGRCRIPWPLPRPFRALGLFGGFVFLHTNVLLGVSILDHGF